MKKIGFILLVFWLNLPVNASTLDGKDGSFNDLHQLLLSKELTPIDAASVGAAPAYYAVKGFLGINAIQFNFNRPTDEPWDKRYLNGGEHLTVDKGIAFSSCHFPGIFWFMFRNTKMCIRDRR